MYGLERTSWTENDAQAQGQWSTGSNSGRGHHPVDPVRSDLRAVQETARKHLGRRKDMNETSPEELAIRLLEEVREAYRKGHSMVVYKEGFPLKYIATVLRGPGSKSDQELGWRLLCEVLQINADYGRVACRTVNGLTSHIRTIPQG